MLSRFTYYIFGLVVIIFGVYSCSDDGLFAYLFKPDENMVTDIDLPEINKLFVFDDLSVELIPDTINQLRIEANKVLYYKIEIEIINDSLILRNNNPYNWTSYNDSVFIIVHITNLFNRIESHGTGIIYSIDTLCLNSLTLYAFEGAGEFHLNMNNNYTSLISHSNTTTGFVLSGQTGILNTHTHGRGILNCLNFYCKTARINHEGINDYYINVTDTLSGTIYNVGNVYFSGNPDTTNIVQEDEGMFIQIK